MNLLPILSAAVFLASALPMVASALSGAVAAVQESYVVPRTPEGTPDLQGIWTNASITTLERGDNVPSLVLTPEQAVMFEKMAASYRDADAGPTDPDAGAPTAGGGPGGYNAFWIDPGSRMAVVKGEIRSSWIVDPADGKLPYSTAGAELMAATRNLRRLNFDNPETRPLGERCIVGFGSTGGPPMLNVLYNNHYQFVQTADHVVIHVEMNHDARIIPIGGEAQSPVQTPWMGSSRGRWDGDTLVVTTTNFHPEQNYRGAIRHRFYVSTDATVTERFTRVSDQVIHYRFTVDDAQVYTQPWTGEMSLTRDDEPMYEYACHEGNYSLPGILGGARQGEREAAAAGKFR